MRFPLLSALSFSLILALTACGDITTEPRPDVLPAESGECDSQVEECNSRDPGGYIGTG